MSNEIITYDLLRNIPFFHDWKKNELVELLPYLSIKTFPAETIIISEGHLDQNLYIILEGTVRLEKNRAGNKMMIGHLSTHTFLGEMSFVDNRPRFCDATAESEVSLIEITSELRQKKPVLSGKIYQSILQCSQDRIRDTSRAYTSSLEKENELLQSLVRFAHFFVAIIVVLLISLTANRLLSQYTEISPLSPTFSWIYLLMLSGPLLLVQIKMKMPFSELGFSLRNSFKPILQSLGMALIVVCILYTITAFQNQTLWMHPDDFIYYAPLMFVRSFRYLIISFTQEYIRSLAQMTIFKLYVKHSTLYSILISSVIFGFLHIHIGFGAVFVTFLAGIFFAIVFHYQKNLISITILHWLAGNAVFAFKVIPSV